MDLPFPQTLLGHCRRVHLYQPLPPVVGQPNGARSINPHSRVSLSRQLLLAPVCGGKQVF